MELRRHHVRGRHAPLLDEPEHLLGHPLVHEDDGVPQVQRRAREAEHGRVVQGRAHNVHVVVLGLDPEEEEQSRQPERGLLGRDPGELAEDPLGVARRPRRVVHDVADGPVLGQRRRARVAQRGVGGEARDPSDREATGGPDPRLVCRRGRDVVEALVRHEGLRPRVLQDVGDLGRDQVVVDGDEVPAGLEGGQVDLDHLGAVRQERGHHVPRFEPESTQRVHQLIGATEELARRHVTALRGDEGEVVGIFLGQGPKAEVTHVVSFSYVAGVTGADWRRPADETRTCSKLRQSKHARRPSPTANRALRHGRSPGAGAIATREPSPRAGAYDAWQGSSKTR